MTNPIKIFQEKKEFYIKKITEIPELLNEIYILQTEEWGENWGNQVLTFNTNSIPTIFCAVDRKNKLIGCAMIIEKDEIEHPGTPWLAGVFVSPDYRNHGIGTKLIESVMNKAKKMKFKRIWLYTHGYKHLYEQIGWIFDNKYIINNEIVDIMYYDL